VENLLLLTPEDAPRLQRLLERCEDFALLSDGEPPAPDAADKAFTEVPPDYRPETMRIWAVADPEGRLDAVMHVLPGYPDDEAWWLGLLLIAPERRGQGLGSAMLDWLCAAARTDGRREIQLGVLDANLAGRRFWEREGFEWLRSTEPRTFGRKQHVVYVLRKSLAA
jgi:GNAT superfamily N-acetyltransferase